MFKVYKIAYYFRRNDAQFRGIDILGITWYICPSPSWIQVAVFMLLGKYISNIPSALVCFLTILFTNGTTCLCLRLCLSLCLCLRVRAHTCMRVYIRLCGLWDYEILTNFITNKIIKDTTTGLSTFQDQNPGDLEILLFFYCLKFNSPWFSIVCAWTKIREFPG